MWVIISGIFLGWALGSNDAANVFGPAVSSNIIRFGRAAVLSSIFIIIGALWGGAEGIKTINDISQQTAMQSFICMVSAGFVVTIMTYLKLPVSTSQAVIGAVIGAGIFSTGVNTGPLVKVLVCWIGTPIGAAVFAFFLYILSTQIIKRLKLDFIQVDYIMRYGLILCSVYGSYALGANNVANTTGVFVSSGIISTKTALLIGGFSIALGVLTYSKNVIKTVGRAIIKLDGFSALISLFASAMTVHFYAIVGVPVSSSQAIIGAVLGIGIAKGIYGMNFNSLLRILLGWILTPAISILAAGILVFFLAA